MHLIRFTFLFIFFTVLLWGESVKEESNYFPTPVSYGDSSGIVAGHVNIISGDFIDSSRDLQVLGPNPLTLDRTYATSVFKHINNSMHGMGMNIHSNAELVEQKSNKYRYPQILISSPHGALNKFVCRIPSSDTEYDAKIVSTILERGYTNTSSNIISGQTHLKNATVKRRLKPDRFQMHSGDGSKYEYIRNKGSDLYPLRRITSPNGHHIHIEDFVSSLSKYMNMYVPRRLRSTNKDGSVTYGTIQCGYGRTSNGIKEHIYRGSNELETKYVFQVFPGSTQPYKHERGVTQVWLSDKLCLKQIVSTRKPTIEYDWENAGVDPNGFKNESYRITKKKLPQERHLEIVYHSDNTVKELKAPLAGDSKMRTAYRFVYPKFSTEISRNHLSCID